MSKQFSKYPDVMTPKQVQSALNIGRTWTYRLLKDGTIPSFRVGKSYRISKKQLIKYVKNQGNVS